MRQKPWTKVKQISKTMASCYILIGPPCSGKSTRAKELQNILTHWYGIKLITLSCDAIREELFGINYKFSSTKERMVWNAFYMRLDAYSKNNYHIIIDNTNCKIEYLKKIKKIIPSTYHFECIFFDIPLWKLYFRNYTRWFQTGKWIPFKVINNMKKNFDGLYKQYLRSEMTPGPYPWTE